MKANRCGSVAPEHRVMACRECQRIRKREWEFGRRVRPVPTCALCGISGSNSAGVKVYRYPLMRGIRSSRRATGFANRCIGSIPICDGCVVEHGTPSPSFMRANGLSKPVWPRHPSS